MNKLLLVMLAALITMTACSESESPFAPEGPSFQLVDESLRRDTGNAQLIATFEVELGTGGVTARSSGPGINSDGKETGECHQGGRWQNPSNKKFAAKVPHAHCLTVEPTRTITLEPITSEFTYVAPSGGGRSGEGFTVEKLSLSNQDDHYVRWQGNIERLVGEGTIVAIAIDATGGEHGSFTFDLSQYDGTTNHFADYEGLTENGGYDFFGLNKMISATYTDPSGNTQTVSGYLYWAK